MFPLWSIPLYIVGLWLVPGFFSWCLCVAAKKGDS